MLVAIDTSGVAGTRAIAAAVFDEQGLLLGADRQDTGAEGSLELIASLVRRFGEYSDIRTIAVGQGPGSFTGIRIGISLAQGIAFGLGAALIPVPLLFAWAFKLLSEHAESPICVAVDTSPSDRFMASFAVRDGAIQQIGDAKVVSTDRDLGSRVLEPATNRAVIIGAAARHVIGAPDSALGVVVPIYGKPVNAKTMLERGLGRHSSSI